LTIQYKTSGFTGNEIRQAARIQMQELNQGFLSSLGEKPLSLIFAHAASSRWGMLILATDTEQGQVVGYVLGAVDTGRFYKDFLFKRALPAIVYFLPKLLSWQRIKKALETLLYPARKQSNQVKLPPAELLDLAVVGAYQGTGIAQKLFEMFIEKCRERGLSSFQIPTTQGLDRAHRFYEKMGAHRVASIEVHRGQQTYIYQYDIQE
jgi:GNAT superfamily N-acetyltransferase